MGAKVTQTLTFHRDSYLIDVSYDVTNAGAAPIAAAAYFQLVRDSKPTGVQSWGAPSAYTGPVLYNEADKYKKLDYSDIDKGKTKWTFMLLVNDVDELGDEKCQPQAGRRYGHLVERDHLNIYVKKWPALLSDAEWQHDFYRKALDLEMQEADGREYVEKKHAQYLPKRDAQPAKSKRAPRSKTG